MSLQMNVNSGKLELWASVGRPGCRYVGAVVSDRLLVYIITEVTEPTRRVTDAGELAKVLERVRRLRRELLEEQQR